MWDFLAEIFLWIVVSAVVLIVGGVLLAVVVYMATTLIKDISSGLRDPGTRVPVGCGLAVMAFLFAGVFVLIMAGRAAD